MLATAAPAQTTWKGLHFGQSRDDVRAQLARQNITAETSQEGSLQSTADYDMLLPGMRTSFPFRMDFHFTDEGGLMDVTLTLDILAARRTWADQNEEALLTLATDKLTRALTDKYGVPLSRSQACDADTKQTPEICAINWHDAAQSVELDRVKHTPRLFVRYQMLAADL